MATFQSGGKTISVEVFKPATAGEKPAIIIAYGTVGMAEPFGADFRAFASYLAGRGYVCLIPYYFERTDTQPSPEIFFDSKFAANRDAWVGTLGDALAYANDPANANELGDVKKGEIGLLGFSLGGHLALRRAKVGAPVKVNAVVEFFAPIAMQPLNGLDGDIDKLPPTQIHHGDEDRTVLIDESHALVQLLKAAGKKEDTDYKMYTYDGEGHGFKGQAKEDSQKSTADFFDEHIHG